MRIKGKQEKKNGWDEYAGVDLLFLAWYMLVEGGGCRGGGSTISIKIAHYEEKEFVLRGRASPYKTYEAPPRGGPSYFIRVL